MYSFLDVLHVCLRVLNVCVYGLIMFVGVCVHPFVRVSYGVACVSARSIYVCNCCRLFVCCFQLLYFLHLL